MALQAQKNWVGPPLKGPSLVCSSTLSRGQGGGSDWGQAQGRGAGEQGARGGKPWGHGRRFQASPSGNVSTRLFGGGGQG